MPSPTRRRNQAHTPHELHAIIQAALSDADVNAFLDAHDDDATIVIPPDGRSVHGRDNIRAAIEPLLALQPEMTTEVVKSLETDGLAMTHGRWRLAVTDHGCRSELSGLGTMVSRRGADGTWRIVLDDPFSGA